jgi:hypothetical protein
VFGFLRRTSVFPPLYLPADKLCYDHRQYVLRFNTPPKRRFPSNGVLSIRFSKARLNCLDPGARSHPARATKALDVKNGKLRSHGSLGVSTNLSATLLCGTGSHSRLAVSAEMPQLLKGKAVLYIECWLTPQRRYANCTKWFHSIHLRVSYIIHFSPPYQPPLPSAYFPLLP